MRISPSVFILSFACFAFQSNACCISIFRAQQAQVKDYLGSSAKLDPLVYSV